MWSSDSVCYIHYTRLVHEPNLTEIRVPPSSNKSSKVGNNLVLTGLLAHSDPVIPVPCQPLTLTSEQATSTINFNVTMCQYPVSKTAIRQAKKKGSHCHIEHSLNATASKTLLCWGLLCPYKYDSCSKAYQNTEQILRAPWNTECNQTYKCNRNFVQRTY